MGGSSALTSALLAALAEFRGLKLTREQLAEFGADADGVVRERDVIVQAQQGQAHDVVGSEAQPTGGIGLCRQLKNEITDCGPIVISVRRKDDRWLATWSLADATIDRPIDPVAAAEVVARLLRDRARGVPVIR